MELFTISKLKFVKIIKTYWKFDLFFRKKIAEISEKYIHNIADSEFGRL